MFTIIDGFDCKDTSPEGAEFARRYGLAAWVATEFTAWVRAGLLALATVIRESVGPFVPTDFQKQILKVLEGRALKKMGLAREVCGGVDNGNLLYRAHGLKELEAHGRVKWKTKLGYYRPDAPPPGAMS
jgi:hypothetical protein